MEVNNGGKKHDNRSREELFDNYPLSGTIRFLHQNTHWNYRIRALSGYLEQVRTMFEYIGFDGI